MPITDTEYRGFLITQRQHKHDRDYSFVVTKSAVPGQVAELFTSQPSLEFAKVWIDRYWRTT